VKCGIWDMQMEGRLAALHEVVLLHKEGLVDDVGLVLVAAHYKVLKRIKWLVEQSAKMKVKAWCNMVLLVAHVLSSIEWSMSARMRLR